MLLLVLKAEKSILTRRIEQIFILFMKGWQKSSAIDLITFSSGNNDYKGTITGNHGIHLKRKRGEYTRIAGQID